MAPGEKLMGGHRFVGHQGIHCLWSAIIGCIVVLAACSAVAQDKPLTIENEFLRASFDRATECFSLTTKPSQHVFLRDGKFSNSGGAARTTNITDKRFGTGQEIEVATSPSGNRDAIL